MCFKQVTIPQAYLERYEAIEHSAVECEGAICVASRNWMGVASKDLNHTILLSDPNKLHELDRT